MADGRRSLAELEMRGDFVRRHIGPGEEQIADMLRALKQDSLESLTDAVVPQQIVSSSPMDMAEPMGERETLSYLRKMSNRNKVFISMIGMGYYGTVMPPVIQRNVLENPGWYTAYTPYQAEVSQGRLEVLLNYQQMVIDLTGMELANASLLDEGTAAAEAMAMAHGVSKSQVRPLPSFPTTAIRRPSPWSRPARGRSASRSWSATSRRSTSTTVSVCCCNIPGSSGVVAIRAR